MSLGAPLIHVPGRPGPVDWRLRRGLEQRRVWQRLAVQREPGLEGRGHPVHHRHGRLRVRRHGPHGDRPQGRHRRVPRARLPGQPRRLLRPRVRGRLPQACRSSPISLLPVWVESSPDSSHSLTTRGSATTGRGPARARAGPPCGCCGATASRRPSRRAGARSASPVASGRGPSRGSTGGPARATRVPRATGAIPEAAA